MALVSCLAGGEINVFASNATSGELAHLQTLPLTGKGLPLAVAANRRSLYASVIGQKDGNEEDHIVSFEIGRRPGLLTPLSSAVIGARMAHISVDRTENWLLGSSFQSSLAAVYPISGEGEVQPVEAYSSSMPNKARQILLGQSNRYAFVPNLGADLVVQLLFDEHAGTLSDNSPSAVGLQRGAGCRHIAFHPCGRSVYLLNELDGSIVAFELDASAGTLGEIGRASILHPDLEGRPWGAQIHVAPDGMRLFASERRGRALACWDMSQETGQLANRMPIETGGNPKCFDITPNGRHLLLGAMDDDSVILYDISNRTEGPMKLLSLQTGSGPGWVEIV